MRSSRRVVSAPGGPVMAWFVLARLLFVAAVAYSAHQLNPVDGGLVPNLLFGIVIGTLIVGLEVRLKDTSVTHMLGALLGGAIGLAIAKTIGAALYWANLGSGRVVFLHSLILLTLPYLGMLIGGRRGEWLQPPRFISPFRSPRPPRPFQGLQSNRLLSRRLS